MGEKMVGARGFEPPTPDTPCQCATRLRYAPKRICNLLETYKIRMAYPSMESKPSSWNDGILECWVTNEGKPSFLSIFIIPIGPLFQYSNSISVYSNLF